MAQKSIELVKKDTLIQTDIILYLVFQFTRQVLFTYLFIKDWIQKCVPQREYFSPRQEDSPEFW